MTNAMIILNESIRLMQEGVLKGSGEILTVKYDDGHTEDFEVPEPIHTYQAWKAMGYQVRKGEKAVAKFTIWKYAEHKEDIAADDIATEDKPMGKMFMKMSAFFKMSQVERIKS